MWQLCPWEEQVKKEDIPREKEKHCRACSEPVSEVTQRHCRHIRLVKAVTSQLRFMGRGHGANDKGVNEFGAIPKNDQG